jgi:hypothetical protein
MRFSARRWPRRFRSRRSAPRCSLASRRSARWSVGGGGAGIARNFGIEPGTRGRRPDLARCADRKFRMDAPRRHDPHCGSCMKSRPSPCPTPGSRAPSSLSRFSYARVAPPRAIATDKALRSGSSDLLGKGRTPRPLRAAEGFGRREAGASPRVDPWRAPGDRAGATSHHRWRPASTRRTRPCCPSCRRATTTRGRRPRGGCRSPYGPRSRPRSAPSPGNSRRRLG